MEERRPRGIGVGADEHVPGLQFPELRGAADDLDRACHPAADRREAGDQRVAVGSAVAVDQHRVQQRDAGELVALRGAGADERAKPHGVGRRRRHRSDGLQLLQAEVEDVRGLAKDAGLAEAAADLQQTAPQHRQWLGEVEVGVLPERHGHACRLDPAPHPGPPGVRPQPGMGEDLLHRPLVALSSVPEAVDEVVLVGTTLGEHLDETEDGLRRLLPGAWRHQDGGLRLAVTVLGEERLELLAEPREGGILGQRLDEGGRLTGGERLGERRIGAHLVGELPQCTDAFRCLVEDSEQKVTDELRASQHDEQGEQPSEGQDRSREVVQPHIPDWFDQGQRLPGDSHEPPPRQRREVELGQGVVFLEQAGDPRVVHPALGVVPQSAAREPKRRRDEVESRSWRHRDEPDHHAVLLLEDVGGADAKPERPHNPGHLADRPVGHPGTHVERVRAHRHVLQERAS